MKTVLITVLVFGLMCTFTSVESAPWIGAGICVMKCDPSDPGSCKRGLCVSNGCGYVCTNRVSRREVDEVEDG